MKPRNAYRAALGDALLTALMKLHKTYDDALINRTMIHLFGWPDNCLVCGSPLNWTSARDDGRPRTFADIDPWFCYKHCPMEEGPLGYSWTGVDR